MLPWGSKGGEPGGGTRKALRWGYAWCVGRAAKGYIRERGTKSGENREAGGGKGVGRSSRCPPSVIAVESGTRLPLSPLTAGETEAPGGRG